MQCDSRRLNGRFPQDDSHKNGDDSRTDMSDQMIRAMCDSRRLNRRFAQDDLRKNGDDSRTDGDDSHKRDFCRCSVP